MGSFYPGTAVSLLTSSCKDMVMARFLGIFSRQQRWHTNIWSCLNTFVSRSLFIYYLFILLNTFAIIYTWLLTMALDNYPIQLETTLSSSFLWEVRLLMNRGIQQWLRIDIYITIHQNVHNKQHSYHLATDMNYGKPNYNRSWQQDSSVLHFVFKDCQHLCSKSKATL